MATLPCRMLPLFQGNLLSRRDGGRAKSFLLPEDDASPAKPSPPQHSRNILSSRSQMRLCSPRHYIGARHSCVRVHHQPTVLCRFVYEVAHEAEPFILIVNFRLEGTTAMHPCLRINSVISGEYQSTSEHPNVGLKRIDSALLNLQATWRYAISKWIPTSEVRLPLVEISPMHRSAQIRLVHRRRATSSTARSSWDRNHTKDSWRSTIEPIACAKTPMVQSATGQ